MAPRHANLFADIREQPSEEVNECGETFITSTLFDISSEFDIPPDARGASAESCRESLREEWRRDGEQASENWANR